MAHNYLSTLQEYLEESGVLENGTDEEIAAAKKEYQRRYQAQYRRTRRQTHPETTVTFTRDEWNFLKEVAKRHNQSLPKFIKQAALAYQTQQYIVPDEQAVARIEQLLSLARTDTLIIAKHLRRLNQQEIAEAYEALADRYTQLEEKISRQLRQPQRV